MQLTISKYYKHMLWQPLAHPSVHTGDMSTIKATQISKWPNTLQSIWSFGHKLTTCYFELLDGCIQLLGWTGRLAL